MKRALLTLLALVDVLRAVDASITAGARARERAVDGARVADRAFVARVGGARVIQVAEEACE